MERRWALLLVPLACFCPVLSRHRGKALPSRRLATPSFLKLHALSG
jgi:hypothetical protein